jgi:hypothetical protein
MYENLDASLFPVAIFQSVFQKFLKTEMHAIIQPSADCREIKGQK